jgi:hypothetical protein
VDNVCSADEFYDFGQDIGVTAVVSSMTNQLALNIRMADEEFRSES